jgi:hypothetical protein
VEIGTPIRSLLLIMLLSLTHLFAFFICISFVILGCQNQQHQSGGLGAPLSVLYLRSGTIFDAFVDSTVQEFGNQSGTPTLVKSCTLLELLELADDSAEHNEADILIVPYQYLPLLASKSIIKPTTYAEHDELPWSISACMWRGVRFGTLLFCQPPVLHINRNLIRNSIDLNRGLTLFDIEHLVDTATISGGAWGVHGQDPGRQAQTIVSWFTLFGGALVDSLGRPTLNSTENVAALESYAELARGNALETNRQLDALGKQGSLALWYTHTQGREFTSASHRARGYDFSFISAVPRSGNTGTFAGMAASVLRQASDSLTISRLIGFLRDAVAAHESVGYPTTVTYWNAQARKSDPENRIMNILTNCRPLPSTVAWPLMEHVLEEAVLQVLYGQVSPRDALDQAQRELREHMR